MKLKKCIAAGLSVLMLMGSLTACGNSEGATGSSNVSKETQSGQANSIKDTASLETGESEKQSESKNSENAYNVDWEDMAEVNMVYIGMGYVPSGLPEVEAAINEITETEINTHVNLEMIEIGSYIQQVSLKMSSGEQVDVLLTFPGGTATFTAMQSQGQLKDITSLLNDYGQPVLDTVGSLIEATTVDGNIYGVPNYRDMSSSLYVAMRTDVLEDLSLVEKAQGMKSLKDLEEILAAVKASDKWSYLSGLTSAAGNAQVIVNGGNCLGIDSFDNSTPADTLSTEMLYADPTGKDTTVKLMVESEAYREIYELTHDWYGKGYIFKDAATDVDGGPSLVKDNRLFGFIIGGELGLPAQMNDACQMPMTCVKVMPLPITTSACTMFSWTVPNTTKYPEAAVTFMSMMYTDPRINNLLAWGIEGRDYIVENGFAKYPEGVTDVPYHSSDFINGNQFLVIPWDGQPADIREQSMAAMETTPISQYLGFNCKTDAIATEIAAVSSVVAEFGGQINSGVADASVWDAYVKKLETSGAKKIVAEYQSQLDAWLAAK